MKNLLFITIMFLCTSSFCLAVEKAEWIQPGEDLVGTGSVAMPNGINDWHIRITSDKLAGEAPASWRINGGLWWSLVDLGRWYAPYEEKMPWGVFTKVVRSGNQVDFYFEPLLAWPGDVFNVTAAFDPNRRISWKVVSNGEGWLSGATWLGQGNSDRLGRKKKEGDGVRDWQIKINNPFLENNISRVDVILPYKPIGTRLTRSGCFDAWSTVNSIKGSYTGPLLFDISSGEMIVYINPILACGGDELIIRVVKSDGSWALWEVIGLGADWQTGGKWYGQDEYDYVSEYSSDKPNGVKDWHLSVESQKLSKPVRWIIRGAKTVWEYADSGLRLTDPSHRTLFTDTRGNKADIYIEPSVEHAGDIFYVSAVLSDGTMINWGVTSTHQLRSDKVEWLGQTLDKVSEIINGSETNKVAQWCIKVSHEKLAGSKPYKWKITSNNKSWQMPENTDPQIRKTLPLSVEIDGSSALLFINPEWAKPGRQFDIEALFPDGALVQWTAVADGAEWARAGEWVNSAGPDMTSHSKTGVPDDVPDWVVRITDEKPLDNLQSIEITGFGWKWHWPQKANFSSIKILNQGSSILMNFAPVPGREPDLPLTIKAILDSGEIRFWKVISAR